MVSEKTVLIWDSKIYERPLELICSHCLIRFNISRENNDLIFFSCSGPTGILSFDGKQNTA